MRYGRGTAQGSSTRSLSGCGDGSSKADLAMLDPLASVAIPASVTEIGEGAFCGCSALASVAIPASVTAIGDAAFWECSRSACSGRPRCTADAVRRRDLLEASVDALTGAARPTSPCLDPQTQHLGLVNYFWPTA